MKTLKEKLQAWVDGTPPANICLLTSVEKQLGANPTADFKIVSGNPVLAGMIGVENRNNKPT